MLYNISALEQVRMLILSSYDLLAFINPIFKYGHAWVRCMLHFNFGAQELYI